MPAITPERRLRIRKRPTLPKALPPAKAGRPRPTRLLAGTTWHLATPLLLGWARQGYVDRYADDVRADAGARVRITNLGISGQTSAQLLRVLRSDASARRAISGAEVITFNIGINDLGRASGQYEAETCGGARNQRCLRSAVRTLEENWDAITEEILGLRSTDEAIVRTVGLGYTPRVDGVFRSYLQEANRHIAASTAESRIPYAEVSLGADGLGPDGLHPDGSGYYEIANQLRRLGYHPLQPH
jgi:lysophospholipase L1-like esterase